MVKVVNIIRASTGRQTIKAQRKYHAGKKTINFVGSAWKSKMNPVFGFLWKNFKKKKVLAINVFAADRFSRNTKECLELKKWLIKNNKKLIVIAARIRYDFVEDFDKFIPLIRLGESQSTAISEKSKETWKLWKANPEPKKEIILNDVEKYFVKQIIFTVQDEEFVRPTTLASNLKSCGITNFTTANIIKWRYDFRHEKPDSLHSLTCKETNLCFAHPPGEYNINDETPLWQKYKRFISFPEFAKNIADNFPYYNGIWQPEPLDNMNSIEEAIDDIEEDAMSEPEIINHDAAPAQDILEKIRNAYEMKQQGILTEAEFVTFKNSLLN